MNKFPIITYTKEREDQERSHAAMAAMVDIDSFLLALDDISKLRRYSEELKTHVKELELRIEWLDGDRKQLSQKVLSANKRVKDLEKKRQWIGVDEIKEAGLYAFINYHTGNSVGYFTPEYLNYYQKNHVKWVCRLPQLPQEEE